MSTSKDKGKRKAGPEDDAGEALPERNEIAQAKHEKRRERVASGQAEEERQKRVNFIWDGVLKGALDHAKEGIRVRRRDIEEVVTPAMLEHYGRAVDPSVKPRNEWPVLFKLLDRLASYHGVCSPTATLPAANAPVQAAQASHPGYESRYYIDLLKTEALSWTVDWLIRYLISPAHPPLHHPALVDANSTDDPSQPGDFVLYGRFEERDVEDGKAVLERTSHESPYNRARVEAKKVLLEGEKAGEKVAFSYFGCSLRTTGAGRVEEDLSAVTKPGKRRTLTPWQRFVAAGERMHREGRVARGEEVEESIIEGEEGDDFVMEHEEEESAASPPAAPTPSSAPPPHLVPTSSSSAATSNTPTAEPSSKSSNAPSIAKPNWVCLEFRELRTRPVVTHVDGKELDFRELYLANLYLGLGEFFLTLIGRDTAWNAAWGGAVHLAERPKDNGLDKCFKLLADLEQPDVEPFNIDLAFQQEIEGKVQTHYERIYELFEDEARLRKQRQGLISRTALALAIAMASNVQRLGNGVLSLILAKDITVADSKGTSTWWNAAAGPGPKLFKHVSDLAMYGLEHHPDPFGYPGIDDRGQITANYGPFSDLWCIVLIHVLIWIICQCQGRYLEIVRPRVITVQSDKVATLLRNGRFLLPDHPLTEQFVAMVPGRSDSSLLREIQKDIGKAEKEEDEDDKPGDELDEDVKPGEDIKQEHEEDKSGDELDEDVKPEEDVKPGSPLKPPTSPPTSPPSPPSRSPSPTTPPPDEPWDEIPEGDWILCIGVILVVCYGVGRVAIAVQTLDPGFYKYKAALNRNLFVLYLLGAAMAYLATLVAKGFDPADLTVESANDLKEQIETKAEELGLSKLLDKYRETVSKETSAYCSLAMLAPAGSPEAALDRFDEQSERFRRQRAAFLARSPKAEGKPDSLVRKAQVARLAQDPSFMVGRPGFEKGSDDWLKVLIGNVPEGKDYSLSFNQQYVIFKNQAEHQDHAANMRRAKDGKKAVPIEAHHASASATTATSGTAAATSGPTWQGPTEASGSGSGGASASASGSGSASVSATASGSGSGIGSGAQGSASVTLHEHDGVTTPMNPSLFGPFPFYNGCALTESMVYERVTSVNFVTSARVKAQSKGELRLVTCQLCGRQGIIDKDNASHGCAMLLSGNQRVTPNAVNLTVEPLLWPVQLLKNELFRDRFCWWIQDTPQDFLVYYERPEDLYPTCVVKRTGDDQRDLLFMDHQKRFVGGEATVRQETLSLEEVKLRSKEAYVKLIGEV